MSCCFPKKFLSRSRREDRYTVKDDEEKAVEPVVNAAQVPQFSWDARESVDMSQYTVADVHNGVRLCQGMVRDSMQIENCTESSIFLLKPTASLNVDDCRDCLLVLGPCSGSLFIRDCSNCTILASCQQLRTRDCHDIRIALLCATQPIIENSNDVHFYPLSLFYDDFKEQMRIASLSIFTNRVKSVHDFTPEVGKKNYRIHDSKIDLSQQQIDSMRENGISASDELSILPNYKPAVEQGEALYIYSTDEEGESVEEFNERGSAFTSMLNQSKLHLNQSFIIDIKDIDMTMGSILGPYSKHLIAFEVVGDKSDVEKICKDCFHLFKPLPESLLDNMKSLICTIEAKMK